MASNPSGISAEWHSVRTKGSKVSLREAIGVTLFMISCVKTRISRIQVSISRSSNSV